MAHPAVVPILEQLCGARFRLDHINVHTHVAAGYSGSSLHGGSNPGGGNGFYHYQGGQMRNGLVAVTWELEDTHCNGGGFCCIPGSERAPSPRQGRPPPDGVCPGHKSNLPVPFDRDLSQELHPSVVPIPAAPGTCIIFTEAM